MNLLLAQHDLKCFLHALHSYITQKMNDINILKYCKQVPVFGFQVPVIADEAVAIDKGTGLVMCCTFGDKTDVAWYKKHNLPYKRMMDHAGKFLERQEFWQVLTLKMHASRIIQELMHNNLLRGQKPIVHAVNIDERCKKEIEFVVLSQWFIRILDFKKEFLELADRIKWSPALYEVTLY